MPGLNTALSANFALWEFVKSTTAEMNGIDNTPNRAEIANLRRLCRLILQPAREALGPLKITSGFRSEELNRFVGGAATSDHRQGVAADVIPVSVGTRDLAVWVARNCPKFDQMILEFGTARHPNWIHLSVAPRLRRQILRASRAGDRTVYQTITI